MPHHSKQFNWVKQQSNPIEPRLHYTAFPGIQSNREPATINFPVYGCVQSVSRYHQRAAHPLNAESAVSHRTSTSKRKTNLSISSIWGLSEDLPVIGPLLFTWCLRKSPETGGLAGTIECWTSWHCRTSTPSLVYMILHPTCATREFSPRPIQFGLTTKFPRKSRLFCPDMFRCFW